MTKAKLWIVSLLVPLFFSGMARNPRWAAEPEQFGKGEELIGTKASEWEVKDWFNSEPLRLEDLGGKVILVRFWTALGCPYCAASAPSLNEFYEKYHDQGLEVVGFYHHKVSTPLDPKDVQRYVEKFGFQFPVAIDYDWKTLRKWWLEANGRRWTSASFLIDKQGIIRYIHPGGQFVKGDNDYSELKEKIGELLRE